VGGEQIPVPADGTEIKDDVEVIKLDIEVIKNDLKQKVGRDELAVLEARVAKLEQAARARQ